jgi:hypothetical protein
MHRPVSTLVILALGAAAAAQDDFFVGPRALGMAGANVATTDDYTAQYYNPAAFGFFHMRDGDGSRLHSDGNDVGRKSWGFGIDGGAGEHVQGHMAQYLDTLSGVDYQRLGQNGLQSVQDVEEIVKLANSLGHVADPGNAVTGDANGGVGIRIGHFGLGARITFEATARVSNLDMVNLGLSATNINTQITNSGATGDGTVQLFTPAQQAQLASAGLNATSIQVLDYQARQQGVTPGEAQQFTNLLASISAATNGAGGGSLSQNTTAVLLRGFGLGEVPLSYGHAIGEHLSIGGSLKLMVGRVYGTQVLVFQDDTTGVIKDTKNDYKQTINVGVDLGVMARMPYFQVGLVGRNLNAPTFKGPTVRGTTFPDVRVDPQVTVGAAVLPFTTLALEVDCDLLRQSTTLDGYDTQRVSAGLEWNIAHFLALRGGVYKNLAESDVPYVLTAGLGLNLWAMRLDFAGGYSPKKETYQGKTYPKEARAGMGLMVDF